MTNQLTALYLSLKRVIDPLRSRLSSLEGMEFLFHRYGWRITLDDLVFAKINDLLQIVGRLAKLVVTDVSRPALGQFNFKIQAGCTSKNGQVT